MQHSLGLIEVSGMSLAITVADVMAKTASVRLLGVERTIGSGWMLVKIDGDVAAVRTALAAGEETARSCRGFIASTTIARPAKGTGELISARPRPSGAITEDIAGPAPAIDGPMTAGASVSDDAATAVSTDDTAPITTDAIAAEASAAIPAADADEQAMAPAGVADDTAPITTDTIAAEAFVAIPVADTDEQAMAPAGVADDTAPITTDTIAAEASVAILAADADEQSMAPVGVADDTAPITTDVADAATAPAITARAADIPAPREPGGTEKTAETTATLVRKAKTAPAASDALQTTCKICGDPACGRHKGEPRSRCIHYQKPILR